MNVKKITLIMLVTYHLNVIVCHNFNYHIFIVRLLKKNPFLKYKISNSSHVYKHDSIYLPFFIKVKNLLFLEFFFV